jgi:hypothetical protein
MARCNVHRRATAFDWAIVSPKGDHVIAMDRVQDDPAQSLRFDLGNFESWHVLEAIVAQVTRQERFDANLKRRLGREAQRIVYCATNIDELLIEAKTLLSNASRIALAPPALAPSDRRRAA